MKPLVAYAPAGESTNFVGTMAHMPERRVEYPPEIPQQPEDPNRWRHEQGHRGRRTIPLPHLLLAIILLAVASTAAVLCLGSSGSGGLDVALVSPEDGSVHPAGTVIVRFRAVGGDNLLAWTVDYRDLAAPDDWLPLANGAGDVLPGARLNSRGVVPLELSEPGTYEVRLVVSGGPDGEQVIEAVEFTIVP